MNTRNTLILDRSAVIECAPSILRASFLVGRAFALLDEGAVDQPLKPYVRPGGKEREREMGRMITMPAYLGGEFGALGLKAITSMWTNAARSGAPRASALITLFDPNDGAPIAVMEGAYLSALRTGAAALFALRTLCNDGPARVAILGAGVIGRQAALAACALQDAPELVIYDVHHPSAEALREHLRTQMGVDARVTSTPRECIHNASAVIAATTAAGPYLRSEWFAPGSVYVALSLVDADPEYMALADRLVVDDWDQGCREGKPLERMANAGRIRREQAFTFRDLAKGRPIRRAPHERIYVNPMGVAIEDLAVAKATYDEALARGLGHRIAFT
jgi:N-[(2S)-2-amino-2-carboxyethyl]-L-glutamate dehydrogenase